MAGDDPTTPTERLDSLDSGDTLGSGDRTGGPPDRGRTARRALTAVVSALALVAAGAFGAALASGSDPLDGVGPAASSSTPEAGPDAGSPPDRELFRHHRHGPEPGLWPGFGGAPLHGELVVPDPDSDGYRTVVVQRGEVTSASGSSVTVTSADGFAETYELTGETMYLGGVDGAGSLQDGDPVHVTGVREGGTVRALHVADMSRLRERFDDLRDDLRDRLRDRMGDRLGDRARESPTTRT